MSEYRFGVRLLGAFAFVILFLGVLTPRGTLAESEEALKGLQPGVVFPPYKLEDQFRKPKALKPDTRRVIMSANMDLSKELHSWLENEGKGYLNKEKAEYVADITEMPSIITWLFARPKMQKYNFPILLAKDETFRERYALPEDTLVVYDLTQDHRVEAVHFLTEVRQMPERPKVVGTNYRMQREQLREESSTR